MAEESEKRFHAIMDKLFYAPPNPKSQPSKTPKSDELSGVQSSRGVKRPNSSSVLAVGELKSRGSMAKGLQASSTSGGAVQTPLCRPWDRGDLQKRLATFKSMTWFAKPEVVSAVNCARRGWVNVDSDTIACESCGSRLLFSTPSSWTQHQVEKAAAVFSLKLDNGHKLLCPWVDNSCDEALAQFPPTPAAVLVDNYKNRCAALLQLSALPVILDSAIECMRSPQLEDFLNESSNIGLANKSADASTTEHVGHECQPISATPYYQAYKVTSLCGWEPRSLPYFVDYRDREDLSIKDVNLSDRTCVVSSGQNSCNNLYSSGASRDLEANDDPMASGVQYDPSSVVLDCRLCGASVGLWTFSTTPRPVEFIRLVGEVNDENVDTHQRGVGHTMNGGSGTDDLVNRSCSEAGENITELSKVGTSLLDETPRSLSLTIAGGPPPAKQNFRPKISLPVIGRNLRARFSSTFQFKSDDGQCNRTSNKTCPYSGAEVSEQCNTLRGDNICNAILGGTDSGEQRILDTDKTESITKNQLEHTPGMPESSNEVLELPGDTALMVSSSGVGDLCSSQVESSAISTTGGNIAGVDDPSTAVAVDNCYVQHGPGSEFIHSTQSDTQDANGIVARVQPLDSNNDRGIDIKQLLSHKKMEFDPVRQHRHFCPWISSTGSSSPGWKQTLSALQRQKEFASPSSTHSPSSSFIEVDDPVSSVKKLFMSPPAKRAKFALSSSQRNS